MRRLRGPLLALCFVVGAGGATALTTTLPACASRQDQLRTSLTALNAAREGFVTYDARRQSAIVDAAQTYEAGLEGLNAYRKAREPVLETFQLAYAAVAAASLDPTEANLGEAARLAAQVFNLIRDLQKEGK